MGETCCNHLIAYCFGHILNNSFNKSYPTLFITLHTLHKTNVDTLLSWRHTHWTDRLASLGVLKLFFELHTVNTGLIG